MPAMSNDDFAAGYLAGAEHRSVTDADRAAEGEWQPDDGYLLCPHRTGDPAHDCDFARGFAAAWD